MRALLATLRAVAVLLLLTPMSFAQYTKVQVIFLRNIQDVKENLKPDKERDTILDAAKEVVRNADNLLSGHCNYWRNLQHDGRDSILKAQEGVKQSAQSLRGCADALIRTIEGNGGPASDCEKTLQALDSLTTVVSSYFETVEQTRQWFESERQRLHQADIDLAMRAVGENNALYDAEVQARQASTAAVKANLALSAVEEEQQRIDVAALDLFRKWGEEKDVEKASAFAAEMHRLIEESRKVRSKINDARAAMDGAMGAWLQAERNVRVSEAAKAETMEAMDDLAPSLKRLDQWNVAFEEGCKGK